MTTNNQACEYDENGNLFCYWRDVVSMKQTKELEKLSSQLLEKESLLSDYERQLSEQNAEIKNLTDTLQSFRLCPECRETFLP